jgi:hypothetical protein
MNTYATHQEKMQCKSNKESKKKKKMMHAIKIKDACPKLHVNA